MLDSSMDRCPTFVGFHHQNLPVASAFGQPDSGDALLKEHDYIGLSASLMIPGSGSSTGVADETPSADLKLEETDLRLGLGPLTESQKVSAHAQDIHSSHVVVKKGDFMEPLPIRRSPQLPNTAPDAQSGSDLRNGGLDSRYAFVEGASLQNVWQGTTTKSTEGARLVVPSVMAGSRMMIAPPKNGVKRVYSEVMSDATRLSAAEARPGVNGGTMIVKNGSHVQESEVKPTGYHQQSARFLNWASSPNPAVLAPWHVGQANNLKPASIAAPKAEKIQESNDAPPPKSQVVGWPPIRSYRKNTLAANPRPAGEEAESAIFVKVNMDGVTIGRKVDLNAHACYQDLLLALEDMFRPSCSGQGSSQPDTKALRLLNNSEFALTYEDKDGDWMLVGDVPWGMFVNTVRRLRIMRGSEATGTLVPRGAEKPKGLV